ncbi:hypothetical protein B1218_35130, partial [Pseudomonas ogarae]
MKVVEDVSQLAEALASAQREAQSSFGDSRMLVEKYLLKPRHVEIQVFADQHGNCLYLNERDCSIPRPTPQDLDDTPSPPLPPHLRPATTAATTRPAASIIDAAMRQLLETAGLHNRLRMVVAMFLTKNRWIDWREGGRFVMQR